MQIDLKQIEDTVKTLPLEDFSGYERFFSNEHEVEKFLNGLQNVVRY